eukprot:6126476-Pyramimonas_sp.AAC.1
MTPNVLSAGKYTEMISTNVGRALDWEVSTSPPSIGPRAPSIGQWPSPQWNPVSGSEESYPPRSYVKSMGTFWD